MKTGKWHLLSFGLLCVSLLGADTECLPKRIFWSPDGRHAIITTNEQVYLADTQGQLSKPQSFKLSQVVWFADSKQFIALGTDDVLTFAEVESCLTSEQVARIKEHAQPFLDEILAHEGEFKNFQPKTTESLDIAEIEALSLYVREREPERLKQKLGKDWDSLDNAPIHLDVLQHYTLQDNALKPGRVLYKSLYGINSIRLSPNDRALAFVLNNYKQKPEGDIRRNKAPGGALMVMKLDSPAPPKEVDSLVAWNPDWTPDGRSLVYATARLGAPDTVVLGSIVQRPVVDGADKIVIGEPNPLAGTLYSPNTKIVCLHDGRILFSAVPISLPASTADSPAGGSLFCLDPQQRATVAPMLTASAQAHGPLAGFEHGIFEVRPDGKAVTMLGAEDGQVAFYTFATGVIEQVSPKEEWKLLDRPTWRNNDELSLIVPSGNSWGSSDRPELVLYNVTTKQTRCISKDWPSELMDTFSDKSAASKPATTSATE